MTFRCLLPLATVTPKWIRRASLRNPHSDDDDGDDRDSDLDGDGDADDRDGVVMVMTVMMIMMSTWTQHASLRNLGDITIQVPTLVLRIC